MEQFWSKVNRDAPGGCWEWTGAMHDARGYGSFSVGGRSHRAHRFSWTLERGPIPAGMLVCHRCDNPPCVNPEHLFLGTATDNARDMVAKGRNVTANGTRNGQARLTNSLVRSMRRLHADGYAVRAIARKKGISRSTAKDAIKGRYWKHVV